MFTNIQYPGISDKSEKGMSLHEKIKNLKNFLYRSYFPKKLNV